MKNMQKSIRNEVLERKLKEELNWYTLHASEEEYDEKVVESILFLLDRWAPLEEGVVPEEKEAWEHFQEVLEQDQELLPVALPEAKTFGIAAQGHSRGAFRRFGSRTRKKRDRNKKSSRVSAFVSQHKTAAAVVGVCAILLAGNTIHAVTNPENGFFFWMNQDDSGVEMFTSPEGLDGSVEKRVNVYYDKEDVPEWAQRWLEIGDEITVSEDYEWSYAEANELENRKHVASHYVVVGKEQEIVLGVWMYSEQISYFKEDFVEYSFVDSYNVTGEQMNIYKRSEKTGEDFYIICFYEGNCKYYVRGQDNLEELKDLAAKYLSCVNKNIKI